MSKSFQSPSSRKMIREGIAGTLGDSVEGPLLVAALNGAGIVGGGGGSTDIAADFATASAGSSDGPIIGGAIGTAIASVPSGSPSATAIGNALLAKLQDNDDAEILTADSATSLSSALATVGYRSATATVQGQIDLFEATNNGTNKGTLQGPLSITSNITWTMPGASGEIGLTNKGKHSIPIMATAFKPDTAAGPTLATYSTYIEGLEFPDASTRYAYFYFPVPKSISPGTFTAAIEWSHPTASTSFAVVWEVSALAVSDGDSMTAAFGTAQTVTDIGGAANTRYMTAETGAITPSGTWTAGDGLLIRVGRLGANAGDTLLTGALFRAAVLNFSTTAETDD